MKWRISDETFIFSEFFFLVVILLPVTYFYSSSEVLSSPTQLNYQEEGSVVIQANISYQITSVGSFKNTVEIWLQKLENHNSTAQTCELLHSDYNIETATHQIDQDFKNNTIEYFKVDLRDTLVFNYTASYRLHLKHLEWDIDEDIAENSEGHFRDSYEQCGINTSDSWYQHLTHSENNLEADNAELISLTYEICEGKMTLQEKIKAILSWINTNIRGEPTRESQGAYRTYIRKAGDCSDFSTLFVTMLLILQVPARKVSGVQLFHPPSFSFYPFHVGETFEYFAKKYGDFQFEAELPGHAWVEYYHPNYGYICLDPTFARSNSKYINYIGYHYLTSSIGENYFEGIDPPFPRPIAGLGVLPYLNPTSPLALRWNYTLNIEVEDTNGYVYTPKIINDLLPVIIGFPISLSVVIILSYWDRKKKRRKLNNSTKV